MLPLKINALSFAYLEAAERLHRKLSAEQRDAIEEVDVTQSNAYWTWSLAPFHIQESLSYTSVTFSGV